MSLKRVMMCCKKIAYKSVQDLEYDTDQVKDVQANNEYVKPIDQHPDVLKDDDFGNVWCT